MRYDPQKVINGTYGTLYVNGMEVMSVNSISLEIKAEDGEVKQPKCLWTGHKLLGLSGEGEFTIDRLNHIYIKEWSRALMEGRHPELTLMVNIDDPKSDDSMTVVVKDVNLEGVPVANFESQTIVKDTYKFSFADLDYPE